MVYSIHLRNSETLIQISGTCRCAERNGSADNVSSY